MKFTVEQADFSRALGIAGRAVSSRTVLDVLRNVLLEADGDSLTVTGTNLEIGISCKVAATVLQPGKATLPARLLTSWVSMAAGKITCEVKDSGKMSLVAGRNRANMNTLPADEFPVLEHALPSAVVQFEGKQFVALVERSAFAASEEAARPALTAVLLTLDGAKLEAAATDGVRLAVANLPAVSSDKHTVLVPARSLMEVARVARGAERVVLGFVANQVRFLVQQPGTQVSIVSQLIEARYPDYRALIPKTHQVQVTVDTASMVSAIRAASLFATTPISLMGGGCLRLTVEHDRLRIEANDSQTGDAAVFLDATVETERLPVDTQSEGSPLLSIGLASKWLAEGLAAVDTTDVRLLFATAVRPVLLQPFNDASYQYVLMPRQPGQV